MEKISDLNIILKEFISEAQQIFYHVSIQTENVDMDLLSNQLVFDILFDKYCKESQRMTRYNYSCYMSKFLYGDNFGDKAIDRNMKDALEEEYNIIKYSGLQDQILEFGVDLDKYAQFYTPKMNKNIQKKKRKVVWDLLFYNSYNMITYRQYRRQVKQNGNYNYETFINELKEYNTFVKKLLPVENESVEKYFRMSMDYYLLESYKRIDFNFKLVDVMGKIGMDEIQKDHFLVKRFHPVVLYPMETDNQLSIGERVKYYRPLLIVEDKLQKQMQESQNDDVNIYGIKLLSYQMIRAKAYELFFIIVNIYLQTIMI